MGKPADKRCVRNEANRNDHYLWQRGAARRAPQGEVKWTPISVTNAALDVTPTWHWGADAPKTGKRPQSAADGGRMRRIYWRNELVRCLCGNPNGFVGSHESAEAPNSEIGLMIAATLPIWAHGNDNVYAAERPLLQPRPANANEDDSCSVDLF